MNQLTKTAKLLLFLNTDPAHIGDIAYYLYGEDTPKNQEKARFIIRNTKVLGWEIYSSRRLWYMIMIDHYELINTIGIGGFGGLCKINVRLTPDMVRFVL